MPFTITKAIIANKTLRDLRAERISSLDEDSTQANILRDLWDITRDEALDAHDWDFATKQESLGKLSETPKFGFANVFQFPNDCIRPVKIDEDGVLDFEVRGTRLYCNETAVNLEYIARIEDVSKWPAAFVGYFCKKLAAAAAYPITGKRELVGDMETKAEAQLIQAQQSNDQQGRQTVIDDSDFDRARQ